MKKHLPNILTSLNLLSGWVALYFTFDEQFFIAVILILIASVFDFLDGFVAKLLNSSEFRQIAGYLYLINLNISKERLGYWGASY